MTSDYSRALDLDALANRYIMVERVSNKIKKKNVFAASNSFVSITD